MEEEQWEEVIAYLEIAASKRGKNFLVKVTVCGLGKEEY